MAQSPLQITCSNLFTPGRACVGPTAVVLHEQKSALEMLDSEMCRCERRRPLTSPGCHTSFHYGISGNCLFHQYVPDADTAWGFYNIPTPACPTPPCPIVQTCDGIGADQYNPEEDGTLPTPVVVVGPDGTANCSVIHVAVVTGSARTGSGLYCIGSHNFSEFAYRCLVKSLCYVFETNGITPVGYTTLLTHIDELYDLDLNQLAIDIQACLDYVPPPLPPCDCAQTEITVTDSATINLTASGVNDHTVTGSVKVSATSGNLLTANADGLFSTQTSIVASDTTSINMSASGTGSHTISATVIVSPDVGNQLEITANGLLVPASPEPLIVIDFATCPVQSSLVAGQSYLLTNLVQSSLGGFAVKAVAYGTSGFDSEVIVYPDGATITSWRGTMDFTVCDLIHLEDNLGNKVSGIYNISNFPWFNTSVLDNVIASGSSVNLGGSAFAGTFIQNTVNNSAGIRLLGASNSFYVITNNVFQDEGFLDITVSQASLSITTSVISSFVTISSNTNVHMAHANIGPGATVDFGASTPGAHIYLFDAAVNGNIILENLRDGAFLLFRYSTVEWSSTNPDLTITINAGASAGSHTFYHYNQGHKTLGRFIVNTGLLAVNGLTLLPGGQVLSDVVGNAAPTITNVVVEGGILSYAGFTITNSRLEGVNSTLVANVSNATKTGYVGVLP